MATVSLPVVFRGATLTPIHNAVSIMRVAQSNNRRPETTDAGIARLLRGVSPERLRGLVEMVAFPRHYVAERAANVRARDLLLQALRGFDVRPA